MAPPSGLRVRAIRVDDDAVGAGTRDEAHAACVDGPPVRHRERAAGQRQAPANSRSRANAPVGLAAATEPRTSLTITYAAARSGSVWRSAAVSSAAMASFSMPLSARP